MANPQKLTPTNFVPHSRMNGMTRITGMTGKTGMTKTKVCLVSLG